LLLKDVFRNLVLPLSSAEIMEPYVASEIEDYLPSLDLATEGCIAYLHRCQLPKSFVPKKK